MTLHVQFVLVKPNEQVELVCSKLFHRLVGKGEHGTGGHWEGLMYRLNLPLGHIFQCTIKKENDKHAVFNLLELVSSHLQNMRLDNTVQFGTNTINFANERIFFIYNVKKN